MKNAIQNSASELDETISALEEAEENAGMLETSKGLTTIQAARRLGMSVPWVKLHAAELHGRKTKHGYVFPADITIERVKETISFKNYREKRVAMTKEERESETAKKIFAELRKGTSTCDIVELLGVHPRVVREFAMEWILCGRLDGNELAIIHGKKSPPAPIVPSYPLSAIPYIPPVPPVDEVPERPAEHRVDAIIALARKTLKDSSK